ncbi:MAG TPA: hypothetical protein PKD64_16670 [Pirellulaceae bacterium]|nr:hypothetical protein [Pirellulaceae bacterium]HMO93822.1 hypothetical protein [Pirellulaceae bacterium]HMP70681.1 hypothetical protein [Pirellulaceae bacterium]
MNLESSTSISDDKALVDESKRSLIDRAPKLSRRVFILLLVLVALVPAVAVYWINQILGPAYQGKLEASILLVDVPPAPYYELPIRERPEIEAARVIIHNESDSEWTHVNVRINRHYEVYDMEPLPAKTSRSYLLDRFVARVGAVLDIRQVKIKQVEVYGRVPSGGRGTYQQRF